jgi:hypothetical protein
VASRGHENGSVSSSWSSGDRASFGSRRSNAASAHRKAAINTTRAPAGTKLLKLLAIATGSDLSFRFGVDTTASALPDPASRPDRRCALALPGFAGAPGGVSVAVAGPVAAPVPVVPVPVLPVDPPGGCGTPPGPVVGTVTGGTVVGVTRGTVNGGRLRGETVTGGTVTEGSGGTVTGGSVTKVARIIT